MTLLKISKVKAAILAGKQRHLKLFVCRGDCNIVQLTVTKKRTKDVKIKTNQNKTKQNKQTNKQNKKMKSNKRKTTNSKYTNKPLTKPEQHSVVLLPVSNDNLLLRKFLTLQTFFVHRLRLVLLSKCRNKIIKEQNKIK
jgi:hypothetical protein